GLGRRGGQRLVDDDRQAGLQGGGGQRDVGLVRGGDDQQVQLVGAGEQLVRGGGDADVRVLGAGLPLPLRVRGDHRVEREALGGGDQRGVEHGAREAVADEADAEGSAGASGGASHDSTFATLLPKCKRGGEWG